ncbi:hypothetical protein Patl1_27467 [Pistacia atlantica]|uniref:Uncharacterized protein n=1 Tax=Pistacia atlantica TaxID=434234 RepID=A0ACC1BDT6_9ROSI|nr:hypothetical protein Patl1_27467 [Pistacia atlantica]
MWWMMSNEGGHYCSKKSDDICCDVCRQYLIAGLDYEYKAVNLVKEEQNSPEFRKLNPLGYVPVLVDGDVVLSDSFAISLYLAEKYPQHPLLLSDLKTKAIKEIIRIKNEHPDGSQCIVNDIVKGRLKVTRAFGAGFLKKEVVSNVESFMEKFPDGDPAQYLIEELLFHAADKAGKMFFLLCLFL